LKFQIELVSRSDKFFYFKFHLFLGGGRGVMGVVWLVLCMNMHFICCACSTAHFSYCSGTDISYNSKQLFRKWSNCL